jgi:site-specific DNA recombinase
MKNDMNNTSKDGYRYIAYMRKSDEREERQILSLEAQEKKIKEAFPHLNIVDWLEEEKSAFKAYNRPVFNSIIERIARGDADGIVTWHTNRLSRNEVDAATVTYNLRQGIIKDLKFCSYSFENTPEGIWMLQSMLSQGQYESAKLGREVRRGMEEKIDKQQERGGIVPTGYMKEPLRDAKGDKVVDPKYNKVVTRTVSDPERFELVRKMWQMLLSGRYTPRQIRKVAIEEWGYTLRETKKTGGKPIALSTIYRIFNNPFYSGWIPFMGELKQGHHQPMITLEEYDLAQKILGERGKPRNGTNAYAYTSLIKCGECGCSIVGKTNIKKLKRGGVAVYVHYYCIRKSDVRPCNQVKYTRLELIEAEIDAELAKYTILPDFRDKALEILNRSHKVEVSERSKLYKMQQNKRQQLQEKLDNLIDMRTRGLLDDEEYLEQKRKAKSEMARVDDGLRNTEKRADDWLELSEKAFDFATYARVRFNDGDVVVKRDILMTLGANFKLKDHKLTLNPSEWLIPIGEMYPALEKEYVRRGGTNKNATSKEKEAAFSSISETWRARRDLNSRHPA